MVSLGGLQRKIRHRIFGQSQLDMVIPPEVINDSAAEMLRAVAARPDVRVVLEIGASSGDGSTANIVAAMRGKESPSLHCLELSVPRFKRLAERYADLDWVHCYNLPSVPVSGIASADAVRAFREQHPEAPSLSTLEDWRRQDIEYVEKVNAETTGIEATRLAAGVEVFDLVVIDGSEFTGDAELEATYGARYFALDDINTFKCRNAFDRLTADPDYELIAADHGVRNGFATFRRLS